MSAIPLLGDTAPEIQKFAQRKVDALSRGSPKSPRKKVLQPSNGGVTLGQVDG